MKKIIYLSIVLVTLSLTSCREQDDMAQILNEQTPSATAASTTNSTPVEYTNFNTENTANGDPATPPKD